MCEWVQPTRLPLQSPANAVDKKRLASKEAAVNSAALDYTHDQHISQTSKMAHDCDHRPGDHFVLLVFR